MLRAGAPPKALQSRISKNAPSIFCMANWLKLALGLPELDDAAALVEHAFET